MIIFERNLVAVGDSSPDVPAVLQGYVTLVENVDPQRLLASEVAADKLSNLLIHFLVRLKFLSQSGFFRMRKLRLRDSRKSFCLKRVLGVHEQKIWGLQEALKGLFELH